MRGTQQSNDLVDISKIVLGKNAEGIADDIIEAATRQIEIDMPGLFLGSSLVEQAARHESRRYGIVAGTAGLRGGDWRRHGRRRGCTGRSRRRVLKLFVQRLEHARG